MARRLLLDAADVYSRANGAENRLTEIFAEVLRTSPQLLFWLAGRAFPGEADGAMRTRCSYGNYEVDTQFSLQSGDERPDIRIRFLKGESAERYTFYMEDKLGAGPTNAQLRGYPATGEKPVILVRLPNRPWRGSTRFIDLTWTEVARETVRLGRMWARKANGSWPACALAADAPGEYRLLAELSQYLAREVHVTTPIPLTAEDLEILSRAPVVVARWNQLSRLIERELADDPGLRQGEAAYRWEPDGMVDKETALGWEARLEPQVGWPALLRHWEAMDKTNAPLAESRWTLPSLIMYPEVPSDPSMFPEPAIGVGISVDCTTGWLPGLDDDDPFRRVAIDAGFRFGTTWKGRVGRIFKTKLLEEVTTPDLTLDEQAQTIASWARNVLAEFATLELADQRPLE